MRAGSVAEKSDRHLVCVHASVSGVWSGEQGNTSEQREVMRFGLSAAVINTMLGSNTGPTFGSGRLRERNQTPSNIPALISSEPFVRF